MGTLGPEIKKNRRPLHRDVADTLVERIVSREYPEKSLLPTERELCESMGVSRTVIREAIKLLETQGLVRIEHGRGTLVQEPDASTVGDSLRLLLRRNNHLTEDLMEVRKILEFGVVALAAQKRSEANLTAMQGCIQIMREKPGETEGYVDADVEFHAEIARAAQNPVLLVLLEPLGELLRKSRSETFSGPRMVKLRTRQHEEIFEAIRDRDVVRAQNGMNQHLGDTQKDLERRRRLAAGVRPKAS